MVRVEINGKLHLPIQHVLVIMVSFIKWEAVNTREEYVHLILVVFKLRQFKHRLMKWLFHYSETRALTQAGRSENTCTQWFRINDISNSYLCDSKYEKIAPPSVQWRRLHSMLPTRHVTHTLILPSASGAVNVITYSTYIHTTGASY